MGQNSNSKLWFKSKRYGWGWTPASWQGWLILLLYFVVVVFHFINVDRFAHSASDTLLNFMLPFFINTFFLMVICYVKGEKPRWRWGD